MLDLAVGPGLSVEVVVDQPVGYWTGSTNTYWFCLPA
jgi:hypothetical protein